MKKLKEELELFFKEFEDDIKNVDSLEKLKDVEIKYSGKRSKLHSFLKLIGDLKKPEEKKEAGFLINRTKSEIEKKLKVLKESCEKKEIEKRLKQQSIDFTKPVFSENKGSLHPITFIKRDVERILTGMSFSLVTGPEMETEYYNFEALNIPPTHPARDMQDTFFLLNGMILRTHTSSCQSRTLEKHKPPLRIFAPGKCFRYESIDASHETAFYQVEGLVVDQNITIANLIGTMKTLLSEIFQREDIDVRLRPGYFPFVEPGFELDIKCIICNGKGCSTCKHSGWLELVPCGMVHPNVLKYGGIDPEKYNGFAFGLGLTRLAMMRYKINDIRLLNSGDLRILKQFR
ncbi:MAG: phenylalanine--tRNA ligase subunit alpha [bacterium]|uniref:Phenylalanine--tRNA ligase alpha subunit n=2 Tax=Bacteria candidate phyla TaxID=1783234 RepID=A0A117M790_UNCT6|nr:MAG: Phenylalanine--tRNA ligase alpha subunit [candidate division TA06 bacterium 32_111]KUK88239.1 MAG: Phenylalanine--tRNA ligase alpha subunit [candidate division TA06 bacterium 34_109]MDI6701041.1 phenylalanine--tRNA ligase subunit alpha [bacterium]HAF07172.1 phenylalanine--tRNA ligase subunit alpha [candidate division WOR-3 bacterium]HCP16023.1 phenylalanine--tRNA ligase subunit alpha [candidate division WOR-3 bacterium]